MPWVLRRVGELGRSQRADHDWSADHDRIPLQVTTAWKPGTYMARHCVRSMGTELVTEAPCQDCGADLMMELRLGAEVVVDPEFSDQGYGPSQYLRVVDFMEDYPDTGQFGLWGQWIGSAGAHPNGAFNSIEGGLFIQDKMGRSKFPKYMASGATHLYSPDSDTGEGGITVGTSWVALPLIGGATRVDDQGG